MENLRCFYPRGLIGGCVFYLQVDGPITRGLINSSTFTALYDLVLNLDEVNQPFDVEGSTLLQSVI